MEHIDQRIEEQQKKLEGPGNCAQNTGNDCDTGANKNVQEMFNNLSTKIDTMTKSSAEQHATTPALPNQTQATTYAQMVATQLTQLQHKTWIQKGKTTKQQPIV